MALNTGNTVPAAQAALSSKLNILPISFGTNSSTPAVPAAPKPQSNLSSIANSIGSGISNVAGIIPNVVGNEYKAVGNAVSGAYNYLTSPSGTSYSQANPAQPFQYTPLVPGATPNFTSTTGQESYQPPASSNALYTLGQSGNQAPASGNVQPAQAQPYASDSYVNPNAAYTASAFNNAPAGTPATIPTTSNTSSNGISLNGLISQLVGIANGSKSAISDTNTKIGNLQTNLANDTGALANEGGVLNYQTGRQGVLQQTEAAKESALQGQLSNELTASSQNIGAIESAAGLTTPATQNYNVSPGSLVYNSQGQLVASGPQLGGIGSQQYYDPSNPGSTSGATPFTAGEVAGNQALGTQYAQNVSANNQAQSIKSQIDSYLGANPNLNPSALSDVNSVIQLLNGKVSNPAYQTLSNMLSEYVSTLAPILGVGGDTTNLKTQIAQGFINAKASGQSISTVLDGIEQLAEAKLQSQNGGSNGSPSTTSSGSTVNTALGPINTSW